ncbi:hypothetical protein NBRC110019_24180 [Neptunitalea chrysea]|uniref:Secretion system C-terminal sorting domain-containing protein n=1 Tax=Neptunitalea chrysea TaxID=1647581 RepID=A0A9W6EW50_9FLAO|nr:T9SS type A sorting domain-containing protein [Neptunitalea chrysea]GLB53377.1 hypothetical protein NBRC110019_24180 [Neptunitalea chrysea]
MKFSAAALANETFDATTIAVYPNPVKEVLQIQGVDALNVSVYNMLGQRMDAALSNNTVNMSGLVSGVYLVTIQAENGSKTLRVIKN